MRKWLAIIIIVLFIIPSCQKDVSNDKNSITRGQDNLLNSNTLGKTPYETNSSTDTVVPNPHGQRNNMNLIINPLGRTIEDRINPPEGFERIKVVSLSKEMKPVMIEDMEIGDVFIQGGSPGHCVIVVDMAMHAQTGEKLFLLAQSYMPAQDIHILKNPQDPQISPWYSIKFGDTLITPEWTFKRTDLKRFSN
jgi:hypothetical protein